MKGFNILLTVVIVLIAVIFGAANTTFSLCKEDDSGRPYRVEVYRAENEIKEIGCENINFDKYSYVKNVERLTDNNLSDFYSGNNFDYMIFKIDDNIYRIDYLYHTADNISIIILNIFLGVMALSIISIMLFIKYKIIRPFNILKDVPAELSRGNLSIPLKESKSRYFGGFVWGMDMLRERLEEQKANELELQKEKKTIVLSLSHDIKTPLGIIELYAKALEKNLYKDEKKQKQVLEAIIEKCNEIKKYVSDIVKSSKEDFLNLEVNEGEFYLSETVKLITKFYIEKMSLLKIDFSVGEYTDCVLKGDIDRSVEVLQNITENAIKYGDGREISILFEQEEDCILVTIKNSGCALNENELTHIFDSFWRGSNVGSNSGSGLGLYICRQIMMKMDGDIFAHCSDGVMSVTAVFRMA